MIDVYHPDFRTAAGATRLRFLWDQSLVPQAGEAGPPTAPALPGFTPTGGATFGVEYNQATINAELNAFNPPATPAYQTVRHQPPIPANINGTTGHGTFVTGAAAGNGLGQGPGTFTGGAPGASLIFVRPLGVPGTQLAADNRAVNNLVRVTVRNRGTQAARNVEVFLCWADPGTSIPFPGEWRSTGIFTGAAPGFPNQSNVIVIPQLNAGAFTTVDFAWAPPAPGSNLAGDNHFCLLVRLEHAADPSNVGAGGFPAIPASNNLGLRNVGVV